MSRFTSRHSWPWLVGIMAVKSRTRTMQVSVHLPAIVMRNMGTHLRWSRAHSFTPLMMVSVTDWLYCIWTNGIATHRFNDLKVLGRKRTRHRLLASIFINWTVREQGTDVGDRESHIRAV